MDVGVSRVFCKQDVDRTCTLPGGSPTTLNCTNSAWYRLVQHDQICSGYVQPFLAHRGRNQDVDLTVAKSVELLKLLFLRHSALRTSRGLADKRVWNQPFVALQDVDHALNGIPVFREDEDLPLWF